MSEHVLVTPTRLLHEAGHFQGFHADVARYLPAVLQSDALSYRPRDAMEQDPSFKQLIPYCLIRRRDAAGGTHLFHYRRGSGQGESRLRAKRSIGVGGHVSSEDAAPGRDAHDVYRQGMRRELQEEVDIRCGYQEQCVGLINDDETEVGRVHLGVVHLIDVETADVHPREDEMLDAGFASVESLMNDLDAFETWSRICLESLFATQS